MSEPQKYPIDQAEYERTVNENAEKAALWDRAVRYTSSWGYVIELHGPGGMVRILPNECVKAQKVE